MKKDVQKQNITDDENEDYGVSDQEIIRIARQRRKNKGLYQCEQCEREINNKTTTRRQNGSIYGENICDLCDKKS